MQRDQELTKTLMQGINDLEGQILDLSALDGRALCDRYVPGWDPVPLPAGFEGLSVIDFLARGAR
jgi:hypothetical protein